MRSLPVVTLAALALCVAGAQAQPSAPPTSPGAIAEAPLPATRAGAIERAARLLETRFTYPEAGRRYAAALRERLEAGAYDGVPVAELPARLTADLQAVAPDRHLKVFREGDPPVGPTSQAAPGPAPRREFPPPIAEAKWLEPGVAYIAFRAFLGTPEEVAAVRAFMQAHLEAKTLIIDARQHHGGEVAEMNVMLPYLYARRTELVAMDVSTAEAERFPNEDASMHPAPGPPGISRLVHVVEPHATERRLFGAKVFYLTSRVTGSAGEHLALALKRTKRGVLVGEATAGANHFGGPEPIGMGLSLWLPVGRTLDPDTGKDWEGVGVQPDVAVPADQALETALRLARR